MCIVTGQGQTTPGAKFLYEQKPLVTLVIFYKFQTNLWSLILYNFFHDVIHVYSPGAGAGADSPRGQSFDVNRNVLSLHSFVAILKKCLRSLILYNFFHDLIHVYSPRGGADSPQGTKFWCQQKGLIILHICCKFQRNLFEVWFYTISFMINTCI